MVIFYTEKAKTGLYTKVENNRRRNTYLVVGVGEGGVV